MHKYRSLCVFRYAPPGNYATEEAFRNNVFKKIASNAAKISNNLTILATLTAVTYII